MVDKKNSTQGCVDCNKLNYAFDIRLVDEQNNPLPGIPYRLTVGDIERSGTTDEKGELLEQQLKPGHATLVLDSQPLLNVLSEPQRLLRSDRNPDNSPIKDQARQQQRRYHYCRIGDLVADIPTIENWQKKKPPEWHFPDPAPKGKQIDYYTSEDKVTRWTLEVCPFRAWVPLLTYKKQYDLINAYNLLLMTILVYADGDMDEHGSVLGSVNYFFDNALLDLSKTPAKINDQILPPLVTDVPFSERFYDHKFIDSSSDPYKIGDTQLFYAISHQQAIISWRGTAGGSDVLTDLTAVQTSSAPVMADGLMHAGFKQAYYLDNNQKFEDVKKAIESLVTNKALFICGHSLGGALALINSIDWDIHSPLLYTYGMPRVFNRGAVDQLQHLSHFRHINDQDYVTTIPGQQLTGKKLALMADADWGSQTRLSWGQADEGDYRHHGEVIHFIPAKVTKLNTSIGNRPRSESSQLKVILAPVALNINESKVVNKLCQEYGCNGQPENPSLSYNPYNFADHPSSQYARYLYQRLYGYYQGNEKDSHAKQKQAMEKTARISPHYQSQNQLAADMMRADTLLIQALDKTVSASPSLTQVFDRFARVNLANEKQQAHQLLTKESAPNQLRYTQHPVYQYEIAKSWQTGNNIQLDNHELVTSHAKVQPTQEQKQDFNELVKLVRKQRDGLLDLK